MGTPYLGKLSDDEKKYFDNRKEGNTLHAKDRVKADKKPSFDSKQNLPIRGQKFA